MVFIIFIFSLTLLTTNEAADASSYSIDISDGILKNISPQKNIKIDNLDLSSMGIRRIEPQAFDQLPELTTLNLSNNSFLTLPEFVFANLTKLKKLSLANNLLYSLENSLVSLHNLEILNLSYTNIRHIRRGHLFSLLPTAKIITEGNVFQTMSNRAFDNPFLKNEVTKSDFYLPDYEQSAAVVEANYWKMTSDCSNVESVLIKHYSSHRESEMHLDKNTQVKICVQGHDVVRLEELILDDNSSSSGCRVVRIDYERRRIVATKDFYIQNFNRDWYRLQKLQILELDFSYNSMVEIDRELLNDLPGDLGTVNLKNNFIAQIDRHVIENENLKILILSNNLIKKIEEGAFENTKLSSLYLSNNLIESLDFIKTLPATLTEISLDGNQIKTIDEDVFTGLPNLLYLNLRKNEIERLNKNMFRGLRSLSVLDLSRNHIKSVEPGSFRHLYSLNVLNLYNNFISNLERASFEGLASLKTLNLGWNKIQNVTKFSFADLPITLDYLYLEFNEISELEIGSFEAIPRITLSLDSNKIQRIDRGVFDTPFLQNLHLYKNAIKVIESDAFIRTPYLKKLWLGSNNIEKIEKGALRNLGYLSILDISKNPIKVLENGIFYGLPKVRGHFVYFGENKIEIIEGGVYEDLSSTYADYPYIETL